MTAMLKWIQPVAKARARQAEHTDIVLRTQKRSLFRCKRDQVVLEIGAGLGTNLKYYKHARQVILADQVRPPFSLGEPYDVRTMACEAECVPLPDNSIDVLICSLTLCSVDDLEATLAEVTRLLRPGGTFRFIEHVAADPKTHLRRLQDYMTPLCRLVDHGCRPSSDPMAAVRASGLTLRYVHSFSADIGTPLARDFVACVAQRPRG